MRKAKRNIQRNQQFTRFSRKEWRQKLPSAGCSAYLHCNWRDKAEWEDRQELQYSNCTSRGL